MELLLYCYVLLPLVPAVAVRESERANPGVPVVRIASRGIVGPGVPERTIIARIDRHLAVISEVGVTVLNATAVDQC